MENLEFPDLTLKIVRTVKIPFDRLESLVFMAGLRITGKSAKTFVKYSTSIWIKVHIMLVDPLERMCCHRDKVSTTYISSSQEISEIAKQLIYEVDRRLEKDLYSDWLIMMPTIKAIVEWDLQKRSTYLFDNGPQSWYALYVIGSE